MTKESSRISLSVIVPCYNMEKYLEQSLGCLERQWEGRTDYEIILVNDASVDDTIFRLTAFKERHKDNVVVIDKKVNEGVSAARNSALDVARGKWVVFFDPDDALVDGGYGRLLTLAESNDIDILSFGVKLVRSGERIGSLAQDLNVHIDWQGSSLEFITKYSFGISCSSFYKREMIGTKRYSGLTICEDTLFNLSILLENRKMARTDSQIYYYLVHPSSATTTINPVRLGRHCDDIMTAIKALHNFKDGQNDSVKQRLTEHQSVFSVNVLTRLLLSDKPRDDAREKVRVLKQLCLFPLSGSGVMTRLINVVFTRTWLLPIVRPLYRMYRRCCD